MSDVSELKTLESIVYEVLKESVEARKDDFILLYRVCEKLGKYDLLQLPFGFAIYRHKDCGMPNWKSVERCRRRVQAKYPELKDTKVELLRMEEEECYREYART